MKRQYTASPDVNSTTKMRRPTIGTVSHQKHGYHHLNKRPNAAVGANASSPLSAKGGVVAAPVTPMKSNTVTVAPSKALITASGDDENAHSPQFPPLQQQTAMTKFCKAIRNVPCMGVIHVLQEAAKMGYVSGHPDWCNLGQGQPEEGEMDGAPPRITDLSSIALEHTDNGYGPIGGTVTLCTAIAQHYNRLYRVETDLHFEPQETPRPPKSQFGPENVSVAAGGRLALTRLFATLDTCRVGYVTPDYPCYEDLFDSNLAKLSPVRFETTAENGFQFTPADVEKFIITNNIDAFLLSNPCNPTGKVIHGDELKQLVDIAKRHRCLLIVDEFYSQYIYDWSSTDSQQQNDSIKGISAAKYIDDIDETPVLLIDGLTKNWRYPGWRVGWIVGPRDIISSINRAASSVDGGMAQPIQRLAMKALEPAYADKEFAAIRKVFSAKRRVMIQRLEAMGIKCSKSNVQYTNQKNLVGTFYLWASVADLPSPLNTGHSFFKEALKAKVITVPGTFFDVNPGKKRTDGPFEGYIRMSFGPSMSSMVAALDRLQAMIESHQAKA